MSASAAVSIVSAGILAGCGAIYTSPSVGSGSVFNFSSTDLKVDVVRLTFESTAAANLTTYVPARLPLGFQPAAVARAVTATARIPGVGPVPLPTIRAAARPGSIVDNLPPTTPPPPYRIGVADVLLLAVNVKGATVSDLPALLNAQSKRQGFVVQDDGAIAIPDVGRVKVAGKVLADAENAIFQAVVKAGLNPSFSLEISEFKSQRIAVGGAVREPKLVPITLKPLYLHEAIAAAGGMSITDPKISKVQVFRNGKTYQVGVERFRNDPGMRKVAMLDGDAVLVVTIYDEAKARALFAQQLALRGHLLTEAQMRATAGGGASPAVRKLEAERALFKERLELGAVKQDYAYLTGETRKAQRFKLPFERKAVLADILFGEGGFDIRTADFGEIYVLRRSTDPSEAGGVTAYHLNAANAVNLTLASMFQLHAGDVVFVAEQPVTAWNRAISQVLPTLFLSAANLARGL